MKRKCDLCDREATYHDITIVKGEKIEKHLCDYHAAQEGLAPAGKPQPTSHTPINELLTNFVKLHSGAGTQQDKACGECGMTFEEFREASLLGCPQCYEAFERMLTPLIEKAHEGASRHIGKTPGRAGTSEQRQTQLLRTRRRLEDAVAREDYETAARLRDQLSQLEGAGE